MGKPMTTDEFVQRAKAVHGTQYDYTDTVYRNMKTKVRVCCSIHGVFEQLPQAHLRGQGCPECGRQKYVQTMQRKYGVANPMQSAEFFEKARTTCQQRYGSAWATSNEAVQSKIESTNQLRYGVNRPIQSVDIHDKMVETVQATYGVSNVAQSLDVREKARKTCLERYGVDEPLRSAEIREKICQTNRLLFGGNAPMCSEDVREKTKKTVQSRYGVDSVAQSPLVLKKICQSKRDNGSFNTSSSEETLYLWLCDVFGTADVKRQYDSDDYPFACDFYIKSRDLYLELNASWTHGSHWYTGSKEDAELVQVWAGRNTKYYRNALDVWTKADVKKRKMAQMHCLNYVVFWDSDLRDAHLWFAMGCPDGQDWKCMYSWFPVFQLPVVDSVPVLTGTPFNLSKIAKSYQFSVFYRREWSLWLQNPEYRGLSLQVWLLYNRLCYQNKALHELTCLDILRGFTISGVLKGYTVFHTGLLDEALTKYPISSVYDPCAGWGERMLYCYSRQISYEGVDINEALQPGYSQMIHDYHIDNAEIRFGNSSLLIPNHSADAIVTCPPYGSLEKYSEHGAENLSDEEFVDWWSQVVQKCLLSHPTYFMIQTNQKWKHVFQQVICSFGFEVVDEFQSSPNSSNHFTRRNGVNTKREFESLLVFQKPI